jgi:hypothetical protein
LKKTHVISFDSFRDANGNSRKITNIKTIVFSVIGDYANYIPFHISVSSLFFSSRAILVTENFKTTEKTALINYPNPFTNKTSIRLSNSSEFIQIKVFDLLGRLVDFKKLNTDNSLLKVTYNVSNLKTGVYKYLLIDDHHKSYSGTFIIH